MHQMTAADKDTQHSCIYIKLCRPSFKPSLHSCGLGTTWTYCFFTIPMLMAMLSACSVHWQSRVHSTFAGILTVQMCSPSWPNKTECICTDA